MRRPQDKIAQRQLVYQLALAIDLFGLRDGKEGLDALIAANPRSIFSTHVTHNIGIRRARWLEAYVWPARTRDDATSLLATRSSST